MPRIGTSLTSSPVARALTAVGGTGGNAGWPRATARMAWQRSSPLSEVPRSGERVASCGDGGDRDEVGLVAQDPLEDGAHGGMIIDDQDLRGSGSARGGHR